MRARLAALLGLAALACSGEDTAKPVAQPLPPGALARVGEVLVDGRLIASLTGPGVTRTEAWQALQHDLLLSQEQAHRSGISKRTIQRGLLSRQLASLIERKAADKGPATPEELEAASSAIWLDVDRPRAVSTIDAFFPVDPMAPDEAAFALAERLHAEVAASKTVEEFAQKFASVASDPQQAFRLVRRPAMAEDGRVVPLGPVDAQLEPLPPEVARAAAALRVGEVSPVVGGTDGFHILYAISERPALRVDSQRRQELLWAEVVARRAAPALQLLQEELTQKTPAMLVPHHASLTRLVWQQRD